MGLQQSFQHVLPSSAGCMQALAERRAQMQSHVSADAALLCATGCNDDSRLRLSTWAWTAHTSMPSQTRELVDSQKRAKSEGGVFIGA